MATNVNFQKILDTLKEDVSSLATTTFKEYREQAKADALKLVEDMKENLKTWTLQLAEGKISKNDFEFLVLGQKDSVKMEAITQAGLALIKADQLKNSLLNTIVKTVFDLI